MTFKIPSILYSAGANASPLKSRNETYSEPSRLNNKKRAREEKKCKKSNLKRAFPNHYAPQKGNISEIYGFDFEVPPLLSSTNDFFQLREQVGALESLFLRLGQAKKISYFSILNVRIGIKQILISERTHEEKMAELGALYFLLETEIKSLEELTSVPSYMESLIEELNSEIAFLDTPYNKSGLGEISSLPSGKISFLLITFARLALTEEQKINVGGLYAIMNMLIHPQSPSKAVLQPEHLSRIKNITNNILTQPKLKSLLELPVEIHPDLAWLIQLDLKLKFDEKITPLKTARACLVALFYDLRQRRTLNCYAVSALIFAGEAATYDFLLQMFSLLSAGNIVHKLPIPIAPLVRNRLSCRNVLKRKCNFIDFVRLPVCKQILKNYGLEQYEIPPFNRECSIRKALKKILAYNGKAEVVPLAELQFQSFRNNSLITLMLTACEFKEQNFSHNEDEDYARKKRDLIDGILKPIKQIINPHLFSKIKEAVSKFIWFENDNDYDITTIKNRLILLVNRINKSLSPDQHKKKVTAPKHLKKVISIRSGFANLDTISELQNELASIVAMIRDEGHFGEQNFKILIDFILSVNFAKQIALFCQKQMKTTIEHRLLLQENLLVLKQFEGSATRVAAENFNIQFTKKRWAAEDAYQFLEELHEITEENASHYLRKNHLVLMNDYRHEFTARSHMWSDILTKGSFETFAEEYFFNPAKKWLNQPLSRQVLERIVNRVPSLSAKRTLKMIGQEGSLSYQEFAQKVLSFKEMNDLNLPAILDEEYSKFPLGEINLEVILKNAGIVVESDLLESLQNSLNESVVEAATPFFISSLLVKILKKYNCPLIENQHLEKEICRYLGFPLPFYVGDCNYGTNDKENPGHVYLIIRYHFGLNSLAYFRRSKTYEKLLEAKTRENMQVSYLS